MQIFALGHGEEILLDVCLLVHKMEIKITLFSPIILGN